MNILLTGSGGFIGKNLKFYLSDKYNLLCPRSFELNLCEEKSVQEYFKTNNIEFIIHCASIGGVRGIEDDKSTISANLSMVNNLIRYKNPNVRIILFGSGAMYGKDRPLCKIKESEIGRYLPKDLYGLSKLEIAKIVENRNDITCLNIFACYGYGEKDNRFPSYAINKALKNEIIEINQNVIFDYLWVEDMQKIVEHFIKNNPKNKIINITPSKSVSLLEIATTVSKNISDIKILNNNLNNQYTGDNALLLSEIKNFEFTPIEVGLKKLIKFNKINNKKRIAI